MKIKDKKNFIYALAVYVGTIMGVGLFALPYVGSKTGLLMMFFYLIFVGSMATIINIFYGEVASSTKGLHRLPGYASKYLGPRAKPFAFIIKTVAIFGSLLAYLIIGGEFLANLFNGSAILYTFIFFIFGAILIWKDKKSIGPVELIMLFIFFGAIIILFLIGAPKIEFKNLLSFNPSNIFLPYGVILFSLWGASIVPEIKEQLNGDFKQIKRLIIFGLTICILIYLLFIFLIIGISGENTANDAISGLEGNLGDWALNFGYIFGIIATFTSYITLGLTVKKLFWYDYGLPKKVGWLLASFIPLILFILGIQDFVSVIGVTGAIMLGFDGIFVTLIYVQMKKRQKYKKLFKLKLFTSSIMLLLAIGVLLGIYYFIIGF